MNFIKRAFRGELNSKQEFLFFSALVLVPNLIVLFVFVWPGFLQADQVFSTIYFKIGEPNQWHSFLFTLITFPLFDNSQAIGLYGIIYDLIFAVSVSWSVQKLRTLGIASQKGCLILVAIFALSPCFLFYTNVLYSSESVFMISLLPITIFIIEIVMSKGAWLKDRKNWIKLALLLFVAFELRKNAVLMVLCLLLAFFFMYKQQRRQVLAASALVVVAIVISTGGMRLAEVTPSPSQETASVPAQQIARVYAEGGYIPEGIKERLNQIHPKEYWAENYVPSLADKEKQGIEVTGQFISDWLALGVHNPGIYTSAYLDLTESFWLWGDKPEHKQYSGAYDFYLSSWVWTPEYVEASYGEKAQLDDGFYEVMAEPGLMRAAPVLGWDYLMYDRTVPVVTDILKGIFFNISLPFYTCLAILIVSIAKKRWGLSIVSIPLYATVLSFLLFAPAAYFRYSAMLYMIIPVLILLLIQVIRNKEPQKVSDASMRST